MTGMVNRAKGILGRKRASNDPLPFTTRCLCGEPIQGYRRAEYQVLTCPQCSSSIFIFPRNPLPTPEGLETPPPLEVQRPKPRSANVKPSARPAAPPRRVSQPREPLGPKLAAAAKKLVPPRRWFTTPRLIFAAVIFLVAMTSLWQVRSRHLRHLREELVPEARRGLQALADGRLQEAHAHLKFTIGALDTLRESVPEEPIYRQAFAELDLVDDLLPQTLDNSLYNGTQAPEYVSSAIRGKALILDVEAEPDEDGVWQFLCLPFMDGEPIRLAAEDLKLWEQQDFRNRTRLILGVRLAGIEKDEQGSWVLRLMPDSAVLLTEPRIAQDLGLSTDPSVGEVLQRQKRMIQAGQQEANG